MAYTVKEIFRTLQGEGGQSGRPAVFCRFAGCNLWSGREQDRAGAVCTFCDTDFVGTTASAAANMPTPRRLPTRSRLPGGAATERRFVVLTGGEPLLQVDPALHRRAARARASKSRSRPTARSPRRPGSTGSASVPRPAPPLDATLGQRTETGLSAAGADARSGRRARVRAASGCSRWTGRTATPTPPPPLHIASTIRSGG